MNGKFDARIQLSVASTETGEMMDTQSAANPAGNRVHLGFSPPTSPSIIRASGFSLEQCFPLYPFLSSHCDWQSPGMLSLSGSCPSCLPTARGCFRHANLASQSQALTSPRPGERTESLYSVTQTIRIGRHPQRCSLSSPC